MAFLNVKNLTKSFARTEVLKSVSFSVERGEIVSLIGASGGGKTTLLRCLNFLELADEGEIEVNGEVIFDANKKYGNRALRQNRLSFGLVFQNFNLFPQYTALENVALPLTLKTREECKRNRLPATARKEALQRARERARELLTRVGLEDKLSAYPSQLSGGQSQRVAIARALAVNPAILCFDEPTSALDPALTGEVLEVIRSLKSPERAMLIVTHEMAFAKEVSDSVLFMADGRIEEKGTPSQIFDCPKSERLKDFIKGYQNV